MTEITIYDPRYVITFTTGEYILFTHENEAVAELARYGAQGIYAELDYWHASNGGSL